MTTPLNQTQLDKIIALRVKGGWGLRHLAKEFGIGVNRVQAITGGTGSPNTNKRSDIDECLTRHTQWSNAKIARACECDTSYVFQRRKESQTAAHQRKVQRHNEQSLGITVDDAVDNGRRIDRGWIKRNCAKWERDVRQVQASCHMVGLRFTLAEIKASCVAAGLTVTARGLIGDPAKRENGKKTYKVGERVSTRIVKTGRR